MTRIIICGILGKMGGIVMEECFNADDVQVVAGVDIKSGVLSGVPLFQSFDDCDVKADVIIDFSSPVMCEGIIKYCKATKTALVLCTTGYSSDMLEAVDRLSKTVPVFRSANLSFGVAVVKALAAKIAPVLKNDFDVEIIEKHHNKKVDAPSGTALMLADSINDACGGDYEYVYERQSVRKPRGKKELGIHAVRGGTIVGEHEIIFAGTDEVITISHSAASKTVFAKGAITAAKLLSKQKPGRYDMDNLIATTIK